MLIIINTGDGLFRFININEFLAEAHILRVNCDEMAGDRLRYPGNKILGDKLRF